MMKENVVALRHTIQSNNSTKLVVPRPPQQYRLQTNKRRVTATTITVKNVTNNLPYGCIVELEIPTNVQTIYYALQESKETTDKLLYNSANMGNNGSVTRRATRFYTLPSFSVHDFKYTRKKEIWLVIWPIQHLSNGGTDIGLPVYHGPINLSPTLAIGTYELEVDMPSEEVALFKQLKPLIEKHFGKAALPGVVKVKPSTRDVYFVNTNTIYLSPNKHNLIHELLHATRKHLVFASKQYRYHEETELIEEAFVEGTANMIKDELNLQENAHLLPGAVYGSTMGYNYDYRIQDPSLITQNVQSTTGGILFLETSRYYLGAEAIHKIALEYYMLTGKYFAKEFNTRYYDILERLQPNPDKELFYSICESLLPSIEGKVAREWLDQQKVFNASILPGDKIFMHLNDYYTRNQWIGICNINVYETFRNGSDWAYGTRRYRKNGSSVQVQVIRVADGQEVYAATLKVPKYQNGFGTIKLYFHYKEIEEGLSFFLNQDKEFSIAYETIKVDSGLHEIRVTTRKASRRYYRILGESMYQHRSQIMVGVPENMKLSPAATLQMVHTNKAGQRTYLSSQRFRGQLCYYRVPFIKNNNCEPGILDLRIQDGAMEFLLQRTIGYGGYAGGHQFWLWELADVVPVA